MKINSIYKVLFGVNILLISSFSLFSQDYSENDLKLISFNIRYAGTDNHDGENSWDNRKEACITMFREELPDVFGLQEAELIQLEYIKKNLQDYSYLAFGRDDGLKKGEHTALFYLKEKYKVMASGNFWLSENPDIPGLGWDAHCNRTVTWLHLKNIHNEKEFIVMNTHLDHVGKIARERSIYLILEKLNEINTQNVPVVIMGDMNIEATDPIFDPLYKAEFQLAREIAPITDRNSTFTGFDPNAPTQIIDHIFYRYLEPALFKTITKKYQVPFISDHYPIMAVFHL